MKKLYSFGMVQAVSLAANFRVVDFFLGHKKVKKLAPNFETGSLAP